MVKVETKAAATSSTAREDTMRTVTTYQYAYITGQTTLCHRCAAVVRGLGPVSHGQHGGQCDRCDRQPETDADGEREYRRQARLALHG